MSKRQINSTFTKQELKFIILEFGQNPSPTVVRRKFCQRFAIKGRNCLKYRLTHFTRVYTNFLKSPKKKCGRILPPELVNQVRANNMDSKMLHKVVENFMKRAVTCVKYGGGHFEHQLD